MAAGNHRDEGKERRWRQWLRQWRASGVSVRVFCEAHGLAEANFYAWRRELARRDTETTAFLPVQVVPDPVPAGQQALELLLASGRTVRVPVGFDATTLRQLLAVLEEQPPC